MSSCPSFPPIIKWGAFGVGNTLANTNSMSPTNTTGSYNSGVGFGSLLSLRTGSNNTAVGYLALSSLTTGGSNTAVGYLAATNIVGGTNNTTVGAYAGQYMGGNRNIFIGYRADLPNNQQSRILIGCDTLNLDLNLPAGGIQLGNSETTSFFCQVPTLLPTTQYGLSYEPQYPNNEYCALPNGGVYQQNGFLFLKHPTTTARKQAQTIVATLPLPVSNLYPIYKVQPIAFFYANNPTVSILSAGVLTTRITSWSSQEQSLLPDKVFVGLIKGFQGNTIGTLSPYYAGGVAFRKDNVVYLSQPYSFSGLNQAAIFYVDWRYDNLELGAYSVCLFYQKGKTVSSYETTVPEITVTCSPFYKGPCNPSYNGEGIVTVL